MPRILLLRAVAYRYPSNSINSQTSLTFALKLPCPKQRTKFARWLMTSALATATSTLAPALSEMGVKALSANGALAQYRTVEFATHGALAGEMSGSAEPGLLLTPPDQASEEDDGYLSASEIAELKLDADWVILSACNTAGAGTEGAEALSGLARAFFYAGARSLLVSHWAVNSRATVKLITRAAAELRADPKIGRSEAMRRSALALIDHGDPDEAHPAIWAPFIVVGEGGRASMDSDVPITPAPVTGALSTTSTPPSGGCHRTRKRRHARHKACRQRVPNERHKKARAKPKPKPRLDDEHLRSIANHPNLRAGYSTEALSR